jgi:hypothetical protein
MDLFHILLFVSPPYQAVPLVQGYVLNVDSLRDLLSQLPAYLRSIETHFIERQGQTATPVLSFERTLEAALFALQFLPSEGAPSVVVLTDGIFQQPGRVAEYDDLSMRLCRDDVSVSVVHVAPSAEPRTVLSYITDMEQVRSPTLPV